MADDDIILTLTLQAGGTSRDGYGIDAIVTHQAPWPGPERVRYFAQLSEMTEAGFDDDGPEFLAAEALLIQQPRPTKVAVLSSTVPVTQQYTLEVQNAPRNLFPYAIKVIGHGFADVTVSFTSSAAATRTEVHTSFVNALNAVAGRNFAAAFAALVYPDKTFTADASTDTITIVAHGLTTGDGPFQVSNAGGGLPSGLAAATNYWVIVTGVDTLKLATSLANAIAGTAIDVTTAGTGTQTIADTVATKRPSDPFTVTATANAEWFSLELTNAATMWIAQTHVVSGLQADLLEIMNEDAGWYCLQLLYPSTSYVLQAAAFAEANGRTLAVSVNENKAIKTVVAAATDTLAQLFGLGYKNTLPCYHPSPAVFFDAAWMGRFLPKDPGQINPKFKTLAGVPPVALTTQDIVNLEARRGNSYRFKRRRNMTFEGTVPSTINKFFDVTRNLHWLGDNIVDDLLDMFGSADNIPFTREGMQQVEGTIRGTTGRAVRQGVFGDDPKPTVTLPDLPTISTVDKSDKVLRNAQFGGVLAGGINKVFVNGTISF
jgi:hypothetical protein